MVARNELLKALVDLLDGNQDPYEIRYFTGLSEARAEEINALYCKVLQEWKDKQLWK